MRTPKAVRQHQLAASRRSRLLTAARDFADALGDAEDRLDSEEDDVKRREHINAVQVASSALERAAVAWGEVAPRRRRRRRK